MRYFIVLLSLTLFIETLSPKSLIAQLKTLELKDAVLKRRTSLAPENLTGLQWIKNTHSFSYKIKKDKKKFLLRGHLDHPVDTLFSLADLNKRAKLPDSIAIKSIPSVTWLSDQECIFYHNNAIYQYNIKKNRITIILKYDEEGENLDFDNHNHNLAFVKNNNLFIAKSDGKTIKVTRDNKPGIVNGKAVHRYEFGISKGTFWSPKGNKLAFYHKDESMVTDYPIVGITTTPAKLKSIKYPMAGGVSHHVKVGIYDLTSDKTIYLRTGEPLEQYLTNISWSPDEKSIYVAVLNRGQDHMKLNQYDASTGDFIKTLFEEKDEKYVHPIHPMYFIKGKDDEFVWSSQREGFYQLYHYNTNGQLINKLTKEPWVVKDILGQSEENKNLIITGTGANPTENHVFSVNISNGKTIQLTKQEGFHKAQLSSDGKYIIDNYSTVYVPRIIQIIDGTGKTAKELLIADNPLKEYRIGTTELFTIPADDNTPMYCRMIKPFDFDKTKKYPVLVYVYGGPNVQLLTNSWLANSPLWMHYMANRGYIIFTCENRGSYNRGAKFEQLTFRQLGTIEIEDQLKGVEYLQKLPFVDTSRMAVHGWSYGGFMTTGLMLRTPGVFKVGVAGGPVIDWRYYEVMYTERYMDTPDENPEGYDKANLLNYVKNLKGDLLMIHGTADDIVVWQHSLSFVKKCVDEGVLIDYFVYPEHPHNVRGKDRVHLMKKVLGYIEDKL